MKISSLARSHLDSECHIIIIWLQNAQKRKVNPFKIVNETK